MKKCTKMDVWLRKKNEERKKEEQIKVHFKI